MRTSYVNGSYLPHHAAMVHMEDRGYQFSDGIYEVIAFNHRRLLDGDRHLVRLKRSLDELQIPLPMSLAAMKIVMRELIERNGKDYGGIYLQITRGVSRRDHPFPKNIKPSLVMAVMPPKPPKDKDIKEGVQVITMPDMRWGRRDIKSVSLLANVIARQASILASARESWLIDEHRNVITEGSASNSFIVTRKEELQTHPSDHHILGGITRDVVLELARASGIKVVERPFSLDEAHRAAEAFLTSTSANVLPVVKIDGQPVGTGAPGPITQRLLAIYLEHIKQETGA